MRKVLALLVIVSVTLISACQSVSPDEAKAQFCADLTAYHAAVANLSALSADSTVDQFEAAAHAVAEARDDVSHSAYIVADAKTEALDTAYDNLDKAVRDVNSSMSMNDAVASIQDEVDAVNQAYDDLFAANCPKAAYSPTSSAF